MNIANLRRHISNLDIAEFRSLIGESIKLLTSEHGRKRKMDIEGRLVQIEPEGDVIIVGDLHGDLRSLLHILETSKILENIKQGNCKVVYNRDKTSLKACDNRQDRQKVSAEQKVIVLKVSPSVFPSPSQTP